MLPLAVPEAFLFMLSMLPSGDYSVLLDGHQHSVRALQEMMSFSQHYAAVV